MLVLGFFLLNGVLVGGSQPKGALTPENITVEVIDSKTVEVFWSTAWKNVERYDITYNPTENRVVSQAAGNSHSIVLRELRPNTQYQVTVTAVVGGKNYKSRRLVFRTSTDESLDSDEAKPVPTKPTKLRKSYPVTPEIINPDPTAIGSKYTPPTSTTVRGVEIGLVLLALVVWIIAIALFFHRWGKIRMLLPYQPDYKTQQSLKVPGTGATIVSSCTGNGSSPGQQEGPGCVQHLRWSTRLFEEPSTAKKCSPARKPLRPRVSSAIFPASPSFCYVRTSTESDSPRIIRHAHSRAEFPTESIPLCQVNQPIAVPVIASSVNERAFNVRRSGDAKVSERKSNSRDDAITEFEESELSNEKSNILRSLGGEKDDDNNNNNPDEGEEVEEEEEEDFSVKEPSGGYRSRGFYKRSRSSVVRERTEWKKEKESPSELEPLFFVEANTRVHEATGQEAKQPSPEREKPRRYSRASLKKQKSTLYDDRDVNACKNVPIHESEFSWKPQESDGEKGRKGKDSKTEEMRRKAFLRKVSLQDTYLNYNQDYWLDFKKSGRFHKSIDLGYFGTDEKGNSRAEGQGFKRGSNVPGTNSIWEDQFAHEIAASDLIQPSVVRNQSKPPSNFDGGLKKSDSDPVIFPSQCSCENCQVSEVERGGGDESEELLVGLVPGEGRGAGASKSSWFFLSSNENIPLFSERNGLVETDFDVLNDIPDEGSGFGETTAKVFCSGRETGSSESESRGSGLKSPNEFSNFYEIKLSQDGESESEDPKRPTALSFQRDKPFLNAFPSASGDHEPFIRETEHPPHAEGGSPTSPFFFFCFPKSTDD